MDNIMIGIVLLAVVVLYFYTMNRGVKTVKSDELMRILEDSKPLLIDAREQHEFQSGHIPQTMNLPLNQTET